MELEIKNFNSKSYWEELGFQLEAFLPKLGEQREVEDPLVFCRLYIGKYHRYYVMEGEWRDHDFHMFCLCDRWGELHLEIVSLFELSLYRDSLDHDVSLDFDFKPRTLSTVFRELPS